MIVHGKTATKMLKPKKQLKFKKIYSLVEEGEYEAIVEDVKDCGIRETKYGGIQAIRVKFKILNGRELCDNFLLIDYEENPTYQLVELLIGDTEEFYIEDLVKKKIGIEVKHNTTEKGTFANVVRVFDVDDIDEFEEAEESEY